MNLNITIDSITIGIFNGKDTLCVVYRLPKSHTSDELESCIDDIKTRYIGGERSTPRETADEERAEHDNIIQMLRKQSFPLDESPILKAVFDSAEGDKFFSALYCYFYGVIQGKRMERTRRRKGGAAV